MDLKISGIFGLLTLAVTVYVILNIAGSNATTKTKALWIVLVLILPLIGSILWWFTGPKS
ncbi:MAG: PLD nuclease N-terminal domain-containing protein [Gammaproteobacteria bacterium]